MKRSNEPIWWIPFAGGMMADAMLAPALILITGFLIPLGLLSPERLHGMLTHPLIRILFFAFISLTFFHAAHRLRFALGDLGLRSIKPALGVICYGSAIVGTIVAALVTFNVI
jgi:fumarate reductase subunit D